MELNTGINWYNASGLNSNPGNQTTNQFGWAKEIDNNGPAWIESKHEVSGSSLSPNVTFRFAFAAYPIISTDPENEILDGFAIDSIFVGNRTRKVLVENFSNDISGFNVEAENTDLYTDMDNKNGTGGNTEIVLINYRTPFPNAQDPLYRANISAAGSRSQYYGISTVPRSRLDGDEAIADSPWSNWGEQTYGVRTLKLSDFDIDVDLAIGLDPDNPVTGNNVLLITPTITPLVSIAPNAVMHIAIVEKEVDAVDLGEGFNSGEASVRFVMRDMVPSAAGTRLAGSLAVDVPINAGTFQWSPGSQVDKTDLAVVVFIQDDTEGGDKEVYQSYIQDIDLTNVEDLITSINPEQLADKIRLYPNPANHSTRFVLPNEVSEDITVRLYDNFGKEVYRTVLNAGQVFMDINTNTLASGMYQVRIETGDSLIGTKRLIVSH